VVVRRRPPASGVAAVSLVLMVTRSVLTVCFTPEADEALTLTVHRGSEGGNVCGVTLEIVVDAVLALASEDAKNRRQH